MASAKGFGGCYSIDRSLEYVIFVFLWVALRPINHVHVVSIIIEWSDCVGFGLEL